MLCRHLESSSTVILHPVLMRPPLVLVLFTLLATKSVLSQEGLKTEITFLVKTNPIAIFGRI